MSGTHNHAEAHGQHGSGSDRARTQRALVTVLILSSVYMLAEIVGGLVSHSLALLADAGHMFSDIAALALSLFAGWMARRPASSARTYGYYRAEILAALLNGATLMAIAILIVVEAARRAIHPASVDGGPMLLVATGGLVVNLIGLWILNASKGQSLNLHGAWLHVLADTFGSVGAMLAGVLILKFGWFWADPLTSVIIAALVVWSSWSLVGQSLSVLMEGTPSGIDVDQVRDAMVAVPGVGEVHDLHVWTITTGMDSLSAHVVVDTGHDEDDLLGALRSTLHSRFGISHVTIQLEPAKCDAPSH